MRLPSLELCLLLATPLLLQPLLGCESGAEQDRRSPIAAAAGGEGESDGADEGTGGSDDDGVGGTSPSAKILAPAAAAEPAVDGIFPVQIRLEHFSGAALWSLGYSLGAQAATVTAISTAVDQPASLDTFYWDVRTLPNGIYHLHLTVADGDAPLRTAISAGTVKVQNNGAPTVSLTGAARTGNVALVHPASISFTVTDPEGEPTMFRVESSSDSGATWQSLSGAAAYVAGVPFVWPGAFPGYGVHYHVRITAEDPGGLKGVDQSLVDFGLTDTVFTLSNYVDGVLATSCATSSCHDAGGDGASFLDRTIAADVKAHAVSIDAAVQNGSMPRAPTSPLSAIDKAKIRLWFWQGAN